MRSDCSPGETPVPVSGKVFDHEELQLLVEASLDGWWTEGRFTQQAAAQLADFLGTRGVMLCNSGSSANLLALTAFTSRLFGERRLRPGDEVIGVAAGFPTTIAPTIQTGCVPVLIDIELETYNVDVARLEEAVSPRTRAIMLAQGNCPVRLARGPSRASHQRNEVARRLRRPGSMTGGRSPHGRESRAPHVGERSGASCKLLYSPSAISHRPNSPRTHCGSQCGWLPSTKSTVISSNPSTP
jgi:hypothetical protein